MYISGFGERLSKIRKDAKLTQEELASKLGVTPQAVSKWERNINYPDIEMLYGIANILECSLDLLLNVNQLYSKHLIESDDEKRKISLFKEILSEPLMLEFGIGLIDLFNEEGNNKFERLLQIREHLAEEYGILMPIVRIRDNKKLDKNQYKILIYDKCMVDGVITPDDTFDIICNQLESVCKINYSLLLNKQIVKSLVDNVKEKYPSVVEGIIPDKISILQLQKVLGKLVEKRIPIRNMIKIIECMEDMLQNLNDTDSIVEYIEKQLS